MRYKDFRLKYVNYKIGHFSNPRVVSVRDIELPVNSLVLDINHSLVPAFPDDTLYLDQSKMYLFNLTGITDGQGNYRPNNINTNTLISKGKKAHKQFKFVLDKTKLHSLSEKRLLVVSTGLLNSGYKYTLEIGTSFYRWFNLMHSSLLFVNDIKLNRHVFIKLRVGDMLPTLTELNRYVQLEDKKLAALLSDDQFDIYAIFRLLDPEYTASGIFNSINQDTLSYINLILVYNGRSVIVSLYDLYAYVEDNELDGKLSSKVVMKAYLNILHKLQELPALTSNDLNAQDLDIEISDADQDKEDDVAVKEINISIEEKDVIDPSLDLASVEKEVANESSLEKKVRLKANVGEIRKGALTRIKASLKKYKHVGTESVDVSIKDIDTKLPDAFQILDKSMNQDNTAAFDKLYIEKVLEKQLHDTFVDMRHGGVFVEDIEIEETLELTGDSNLYKIKTVGLDGKSATIRVKIPKIDTDGTFKLSNNLYRMGKQRSDKPIRKIDSSSVVLSSAYGKLVIKKAEATPDNASKWLAKQLIDEAVSNPLLNMVVTGKNSVTDTKLPKLYEVMSRGITSFVYDKTLFKFIFKDRPLLPKLESKFKAIVIGVKGKKTYLMTFKNDIIIIENDNIIKTFDLFEHFSFSFINKPLESGVVKIYNKKVPSVLLLSYYIGFQTLLDKLKPKYDVYAKNLKPDVSEDEYQVILSDTILVFKKEDTLASILFYGLVSIKAPLKELSLSDLSIPDKLGYVFNHLGMNKSHVDEIALINDMFLDSNTKRILVHIKEPTNFIDLFIRANELLISDYHTHPNSMDDMVIKGYSRLPDMLYKELVTAVRTSRNTSQPISLNPYNLLNTIQIDGTVQQVDDINPIAFMQQQEDVTYLGQGGRAIETMVGRTREMHHTDIGLISEATKDSSRVAISVGMAAAPVFKTLYGDKDNDAKLDPVNIFSTSAMLAPYALNDDPKRIGFISIQNKHTIPSANDIILPIRTGYDVAIVNRINKRYALNARQDGVCTIASSKKVVVTYKDGSKGSYPIKSWTGKEEGGGVIKHHMRSLLSPGTKFKAGDNIYYDDGYFGRDIFNPLGVAYKLGSLVTVAMVPLPETYEDSMGISSKFASEALVSKDKVKSIILPSSETILDMVSMGDMLSPNSPLFTMAGDAGNDKLDKESLRILKELGSVSPKAKVTGKVTKIQLLYNDELTNLSPSLKKVAEFSDELLTEKLGRPSTGRVNAGYGVKGKPLLEGTVELKIYIETTRNMSTGDKGVLGLQLKATVGDVWSEDIKTEDGRNIDVLFNMKSIEARKVLSPKRIGIQSSILKHRTKELVDGYFK